MNEKPGELIRSVSDGPTRGPIPEYLSYTHEHPAPSREIEAVEHALISVGNELLQAHDSKQNVTIQVNNNSYNDVHIELSRSRKGIDHLFIYQGVLTNRITYSGIHFTEIERHDLSDIQEQFRKNRSKSIAKLADSKDLLKYLFPNKGILSGYSIMQATRLTKFPSGAQGSLRGGFLYEYGYRMLAATGKIDAIFGVFDGSHRMYEDKYRLYQQAREIAENRASGASDEQIDTLAVLTATPEDTSLGFHDRHVLDFSRQSSGDPLVVYSATS